MNTSHRGFIVPLILVIIALVLVGGGAYFYTQTKQATPSAVENTTLPQASSTAQTPVQTTKTQNTTAQSPTAFRWILLSDATAQERSQLSLSIKNGGVYWTNYLEHLFLIENADATTFEIGIYSTSTAYTAYAKDKAHIYAKLTGGCHGACSYDPLERMLAYTTSAPVIVDHSTFTPVFYSNGVPSLYGKDKLHVYSAGYVIYGADPSTFVVLGDALGEPSPYGKDAHNTYKLQGGDAARATSGVGSDAFSAMQPYSDNPDSVLGKMPLTVSFYCDAGTENVSGPPIDLIDFGDSLISPAPFTTIDSCSITHTYTNVGTYTVRFMSGTNVEGTITITVTP